LLALEQSLLRAVAALQAPGFLADVVHSSQASAAAYIEFCAFRFDRAA
jgi:hypothetical protein